VAGRKYQQVATALRRRIEQGILQPGDRLPSLAELQDEFGVSDTVVLSARRILASEGLITSKSGSGTYVREHTAPKQLLRTPEPRSGFGSPFRRQQEEAGAMPSWESDSESTTAPPLIAARLRITPGDRVMRTRYIFRSNGQPVQLSTSYEPYSITGLTPAVLPEQGPLAGLGVVDRMKAIGVRVTRAVESISSRTALDAEVQALDGPAGSIVTVVTRTYYADDLPVETADIVVLAARYAFTYEIPF
jgi:DNA-binding GntR family transcriptional regulator